MLDLGQVIDGKYEVIKVLGQGGMGTVYLCKNTRLGNLWAIKEIKTSGEANIDLLAEPNILKNLNHPGIPRIIDIFNESDNLYIVEDYISGQTLKSLIEKEGSLALEMLIQFGMQLCDILSYLHSFSPSIIYRDLKPSNIMVTPENKIVLIDFGIARTYKEDQSGDTLVLGSRGYIAPEQLMNAQSNVKTDIYSLGATLYFMLAGKSLSFPSELLDKKNYGLNLNGEIAYIIQKAAAAEPDNRYKSTEDLKADLQRCLINQNYESTILMEASPMQKEASKPTVMKNRKKKIKTKAIVICAFLCILAIILLILSKLDNGNKKPDPSTSTKSSVSDSKSADNKSSNSTDSAKEQVPIENDKITTGIIYKDQGIILKDTYSSSHNKEKGKEKGKGKSGDKIIDILFNLSPASSFKNSKFTISLNTIEVDNDSFIADLSVLNNTSSILNLDLNKTFIVNDKNRTLKCYNPNPSTILSIAKDNKVQNIKIYFKNVDLESTSYLFKTNLNYSENKDVNLPIDVK